MRYGSSISRAPRQLFATLAVTAVALFGLTAPLAAAACVEKEMLQTTLKLREDQSGFAGVSAKVITIEPDGTWLEEHFLITEPGKDLQHQKRTKHQGGKLSKQHLDDLEVKVTSFGFAASDDGQSDLGSGGARLSISCGEQTASRLLSPTGENSPEGIDPLMELADTIKASIRK